jgi:hypothetical protein
MAGLGLSRLGVARYGRKRRGKDFKRASRETKGDKMSDDVEMIKVSGRVPAPPVGWEFNGIRQIGGGEHYFDGLRWVVWDKSEQSRGAYLAAIMIPQWRTVTESDIGKTCRFRVSVPEYGYYTGTLLHITSRGLYVVIDSREETHLATVCEVAE